MEPVNMDSLKLFESRLEVQEMSEEERKSYSCEKLMNGFEANFCDDSLFYLSAVDYKVHGGWTYACTRHLPLVSFGFLESIEEKRLNSEFDEWNDQQVIAHACNICEEIFDSESEADSHALKEHGISYSTCPICLCDTSEHNWEVHTMEMKAASE